MLVAPHRDMVDGMRMDLVKSRYDNYDELYEYCYRVAGTVALMSMPVMGVDPAYKVGQGRSGSTAEVPASCLLLRALWRAHVVLHDDTHGRACSCDCRCSLG